VTARDIRYGRRGGRWADKPADVAALDEWRRQRDALEAAAARAAEEASEQLTLEGID
jgi:hypothetical protein